MEQGKLAGAYLDDGSGFSRSHAAGGLVRRP
jgi:hypothetical protein